MLSAGAPAADIIAPMLALMALTFFVWVLMYQRRLSWMARERIEPDALSTPDRHAAIVPAFVQLPALNFANLLQLPVLFYALCLLLLATQTANGLDVLLAWLFVAGRVAHTAIHVTINRVVARFLAYAASSVVLWIMLALTLWRLLS